MHCSRSGSSSKCRDPTADHMRTSCRICLSPAVQYSVMLIALHNEKYSMEPACTLYLNKTKRSNKLRPCILLEESLEHWPTCRMIKEKKKE